MIINFRLRNFRSFRGETNLSLVNGTSAEAVGDDAVSRLAVVYGANASGKSNLVNAIAYMRQAVLDNAVGCLRRSAINRRRARRNFIAAWP